MTLTPTMEKLLPIYNEGLKLYKQRQFDAAKQKFEACLKLDKEDGPSKLYVERCQQYIETPPPPDWDGVFAMTSK